MTIQKLTALAVAAVCLQALIATETQATTILVPSDQPTIQAGIDVALVGDTVLVAPGTYTGSDNTELNFLGKDLVLMGSGVGVTILDCLDQGYPVIRFENGETRAAVLRDMTLQNNYNRFNPPGINIEGASPKLINLHLDHFWGASGDDSMNYYQGAALHCVNSSPFVSEVSISNCLGTGGVYVRHGEPEFLSVTITGGYATYASGGGIVFRETAATVQDVTIIDCGAFEDGGGGVACYGSPAPTFENCRFEDNVAMSETGDGIGGGGLVCFGSSPTLLDCEFVGNSARDGGGAIACLEGSNPMIIDCVLVDSSADDLGSAVLISESAPGFANVTIAYTQGEDWQGEFAAVEVIDQSAPQFHHVIIAFSSASYGISADASSSVTMSCCDIFGNELGPFGGEMPNLLGIDGNFAINPLFCREQGGEALTLSTGSPCLPANNSCAELVGARDQGCDYPAFWISGRTAYADDSPRGDVLLDGLPGYPRTDESGQYSELVPALGPVTVRPMFSGHAFIPEERHYEILDADQFDQDYTSRIVQLVRVPEDYIDIATAIAYVESGDTILVSPGTYTGPGFHELSFGGKEIVLMSSHGAELTIIEEIERHEIIHFRAGETRAARMQGFTLRHLNPYDSAIKVYNAAPTLADLVITGFGDEGGPGLEINGPYADALVLDSVFYGNRAFYSNGGAIRAHQGTLTLERVTIARNYAHDSGGGIYAGYGATLNLTHCIVAFNQGGGIAAVDDLTVNLDCNDFYANPGGDFVGLPMEPTGLASTFSADPVFCDPLAGTFTLHDSSPCAAANSPCGLQLGAFGTDCSQPVVSIAGVIAGPGGEALKDVLLAGLALPHLSDSLGGYRVIVDTGFSGTVRPLLPGHGFAPRARSYDAITADQLDQDYSGFVETMHRVPSEYPDIQTGLDVCAEGDTVLLAPGTYRGEGNTNLIIDRVNLVLSSETGPDDTLIDGEGASPGIHVDGWLVDSRTTIEGLTLRNCAQPYFGGALRITHSQPSLKNLILEDNWAGHNGGAIYASGDSLLMENCVLRRNSAAADGGAMSLSRCSAVIRGCLFEGNEAGDGGAIDSYEGGSDPADIRIENCTFADNGAGNRGAALYSEAGESLGQGRMPRLHANIFAGNSAGQGGAIHAQYTVADSTRIACNAFFANTPDHFGGALGSQIGATGNFDADPLFCDPDVGDYNLAANSPCLPDANGCRLTIGAFGEGCLAVSVPEDDLPMAFALSPAYPNPFNPRTEIAFDLPESASVDLAVYDMSGRMVVTLLDTRPHDAGRHRVSWTGRDSNGRRLASGVYMLRLRAGHHSAESKLVLLK